MIQINDVAVANRLDGITFDLRRGELLALVGPNGAGKTSLLDVLAGDLAPDRGRVMLLGRPLTGYSRDELAHTRAVLPQESAPAFAFTVRQICALGRLPRGLQGGAPAALIAAFELQHLLDVPFDALSGGERQRAQIVRVLAQIDGAGDALLLLDEPTNQLDLRHQQVLVAVLRARAAAGAAVVAAVHDLNFALTLADRVLLLDGGRVVADGPAAATLSAAAVSAVFGVDVEYVATATGHVLRVLGARPVPSGGA